VASVSRRATGNLPFDVTSFVGRRQEIAEIKRVLSVARLVTLTGVGGVGKSRLALQVARDLLRAFPDGVWLVELDRLNEAALLPHTVLTTLRIRDDTPRPPEEALVEHLADRQLLVVLDNCEHLLEPCAQLVSTLLATAPRVRILSTSREPLGIEGELIRPVPPLSMPDPEAAEHGTRPGHGYSRYEALALFEQRAAAVLPDFALTPDNWTRAAQLCQRLDGIPLAIELAAVRLRVLTVEEILSRLDNRFRLLTAGSRTAPSRHQTLYAVVEGSFELCSKPERHLWTRASVFSGGFDLEGAEEVCAGGELAPEEVLESVTGLVTKSVLVREEHAGRARFRLLETIRQFGHERLLQSGEELVLRQRHRDHYLALAEAAEDDWFGPRQLDWLARLSREWPNLWTALDFCLTEPGESGSGVRMAGALWPYWLAGGYVREGRHWLDRALAVHTDQGRGRAKALWADGLITALQGDTDRARAQLAECHDILDQAGDDTMLAAAARVSGLIEMLSGQNAPAVASFERSLRHLTAGERLDSLSVLSYADLGVVHALSGDVRHAIALCEQGRALCESRGEKWALSWILSVLNFVRLVENDQRDITADVWEMLRIKNAFNDILGVLHAAEMLAWVAAAQGDARRAARLVGASETLWKPLGAYLLGFQPYLDRHDVCVSRARAAIGDDEFERNFRTGAQLDLKHLVAYALGEKKPEEEDQAPAARPSRSELSRREWEVAELVAQGLSDKQIAEHLVISRRTAQTHVANILAKLGFSSRLQIARWVIEQKSASGPSL
jgi:predicted ATPase/DNA-binding CsgD family transcriptional regulator